MWKILLMLLLVVTTKRGAFHQTTCKEWISCLKNTQHAPFCPHCSGNRTNTIYLLYDVNPPEGFNLRRDVYIRLAVFMRQFQQKSGFNNVRLILPPWRRLYHWKSVHIEQDHLPWKKFFDVESLRRFAPVLDYPEFLDDIKDFGLEESPLVPVHKVLQLRHFKDMFENGIFRDKWEFSDDCEGTSHSLEGSFLKQPPLWIKDTKIQCVSFQGSANLLTQVIQRVYRSLDDRPLPKVIAILNAEVVLHEHWADREFWKARRSMRFAGNLVEIAAKFRHTHFDSNDQRDNVQRPPMWEYENPSHKGLAIGGPYLCAHLRRGDFLYGREATTPTLKSSALQIKYHLINYNLSTVFLATDATAFEIKNLKSYIPRHRVVRFTAEDLQQKASIKDGGIAIIDQLICAHAHFFVGTYESTFTYRIYEEREILGFPKSRTFNTLCKKSTMESCSQNSVWPIVY
ncbi:GDP-fucose protein O-fucosyltransferase 2 [Stomoxys calcitrans]|uniref:GDP-fucose protein O-fucosyltransferase 2 n=1 Tax=Stomoxys calcitrans TaxID=35570 RepID=A0A1I8P2Z2_STOCA|nr:GDP-fucose protein O-fucosyltransferase 2 [Stomoxys calcitrans]